MEFVNESNKNETPNTDFLELIDGDDKNQYYLLEKDRTIYRTDDTKQDGKLENNPTFFVYDQDAATSYGKLVRSYKVINTLNLLALDKNIKSFYDNADKDIQKILENQYGYNSESKKPIRDSFPEKDNTLVKYLCDTHYDGYATNLMSLREGGNFHKEIVICEPQKNLCEGKLVTSMTDDNIKQVNYEAKLIKLNNLDKQNRKKEKKRVSPFNNDENSNNDSVFRLSFVGGKRKSKRKSVKKKRVIKNRKNKRTIKKNNKNKKIKNSKNIVRNRK